MAQFLNKELSVKYLSIAFDDFLDIEITIKNNNAASNPAYSFSHPDYNSINVYYPSRISENLESSIFQLNSLVSSSEQDGADNPSVWKCEICIRERDLWKIQSCENITLGASQTNTNNYKISGYGNLIYRNGLAYVSKTILEIFNEFVLISGQITQQGNNASISVVSSFNSDLISIFLRRVQTSPLTFDETTNLYIRGGTKIIPAHSVIDMEGDQDLLFVLSPSTSDISKSIEFNLNLQGVVEVPTPVFNLTTIQLDQFTEFSNMVRVIWKIEPIPTNNDYQSVRIQIVKLTPSVSIVRDQVIQNYQTIFHDFPGLLDEGLYYIILSYTDSVGNIVFTEKEYYIKTDILRKVKSETVDLFLLKNLQIYVSDASTNSIQITFSGNQLLNQKFTDITLSATDSRNNVTSQTINLEHNNANETITLKALKTDTIYTIDINGIIDSQVIEIGTFEATTTKTLESDATRGADAKREKEKILATSLDGNQASAFFDSTDSFIDALTCDGIREKNNPQNEGLVFDRNTSNKRGNVFHNQLDPSLSNPKTSFDAEYLKVIADRLYDIDVGYYD